MEIMAQRYRIYPTRKQEDVFLQTSGCCRFVYNKALEMRNTFYRETGAAPTINDLVKAVTDFKKQHPFLRQAMAQPLQQAVRDMMEGWKRFFEGHNARPTWRKFTDAPSFRLPDPAQFKIKNLPGTKKRVRHLYLPKVGMSGKLGPVEMVLHRPLEGKVKNATIAREGAAWFVSFCVERKGKMVKAQKETKQRIAGGLERVEPLSDEGFDDLRITGLDRNVARNGAVVTNWGDVYGREIKTKALEEKQARLQRVIDRKREALRKAHGIKPGGSLKGVDRPGRLKAAEDRLCKFHAKLARRRKDGAHKMSRELVNDSDILVFEALETKVMTSSEKRRLDEAPWETRRNKQTRKDILDVGWGMIERCVAYKARQAGKMIVRVNPAYTSQRCFACGHVSEDNRKGKRFTCVGCGHTNDADLNAARNIRYLGIEALKEEIRSVKAGERTEWPCLRLESPKGFVKSEQRSPLVEAGVLGAPAANLPRNSTDRLMGSLGL